MAVIPVRLPPLPGEALDSWLESYAHLLHVTVRDIFDFAGMDWDRVNGDQRTGKPWLHQLDEPDLTALSAATRVSPETLAGMTLARYQGTGLAEVTALPGTRRTPRWWRQLSGSRYCPRCLAANGGRWMLAWRIPWVFACTSCQVLLADTCPDCGRRHQRTRNTTSPADVLIHWDRASPALKAALARPLAARLDTFYRLRYRAVAGPARIPDPARARERAATLPSLMWPGWALRLMPPGDYDFLRYRAALAMMLAVAVTGTEDYRTAQELLGIEPFESSRLATFTARLRQEGILEPVTTALCQLARKLDEHGAPVDYARRRRLRRFSQARLDTDSWRRQRYFLTHPGTHPRYLPAPLRLPDRRSQDYAEFVFTMPAQMASCLHRQARTLLSQAGISEPVTWEPPLDWAAGIPWPGPDPGAVSTEDLHPLIRAGLPVRAIAARLATSPDHVRLAAARHPAPRLPAGIHPPPPPEPDPPGTEQLRDLTRQGHGPREIARITGCCERVIRQLLTSGGLRRPAPPRTTPSTRTGSASSTTNVSAASKTSPPRPASRSGPSPPQPARPASASGTASTAAPTHSPPSAGQARSPRTSGTSSPTRVPSSASEGSSPSPDGLASSTRPAISASGAPSSQAKSGRSRQPSAPRSCAPAKRGGLH
jgi:hypothetical protein